MKKVEKTTRPFRYDQNQIPNDYTLEVQSRFKGLDLIDRLPNELWTEVCDIAQERGLGLGSVMPDVSSVIWLKAGII